LQFKEIAPGQFTPQSFTRRYNGLANALITPIEISPAFDPKTAKTQPPTCEFNGLWDTGATNSSITSMVAQQCNLIPIGMTRTSIAAGEMDSNVYMVSLVLPQKVVFTNLKVNESILHPGIDVLIGMDVISKGDFVITNNKNKTIFSFRMPSIAEIDFVKDTKVSNQQPFSTMAPKVGRNDPCPCGSGKKFKKCCGK